MKNLKNFLLILTILLVSSCDEDHAPPKGKLCVTSPDNKFLCNDPRLDKDDQNFIEPYESGRIVFDEDDFAQFYGYCSDLRKDLIKCERKKD